MKRTTYTCDRCLRPLEPANVAPVHVVLVTDVQPTVRRAKLDLCFDCAGDLAAVHAAFLECHQ